MVELDYDALAGRLKGGGQQVAEAGELLGLKLLPSDVAALKKVCDLGYFEPTLAQALAEIHRATRDPKGFSYQRLGNKQRPNHVLAVCSDGEVTFGVGRVRNSARVEALWPELAGWPKNAELLKRWAEGKAGRLKLKRLPQPPAPSVDAAQTDGLMRAILERPGDDAPRLVYADALLERGDAQGDLIRLQVAADAKPTPPNVVQLNTKVNQLLRTSWKTFAGEAAPYANEHSFRRGFAEKLTMTVSAFEKHGERLFTQTPARALAFAKPLTDAELARLADAPALEHVQELCFDYPTTGTVPRTIAPFARSRRLINLQRLELRGAGASDSDWAKFFTGLYAPKLTELRIRSRRVSPAIYAGIAANGDLRQLRVLDVYADGTTSSGADASFAHLAGVAGLEEVRVWHHRKLGDGLAALFGPKARCRLKKLDVLSSGVTGALLKAIDSPRGESLVDLDLRETLIKAKDAEAFLGSKHLKALQRLRIFDYDHQWKVAEVARLYDLARTRPKLKTVDFGKGKG
ncbi:MAG: TIGR02996 domain-containing protein [Myxococcaceae bacterium]